MNAKEPKTADAVEQYLTREQVAEKLQVSVRQVDKYVKLGYLTPAPLPGRSVRFLPAEVRRFMEEGVPAANEPSTAEAVADSASA